MRSSRRILTVLAIATIATIPAPAPASADPLPAVASLVTDYFVQSEAAWYGSAPAALTAGRLRLGQASPAARGLAEKTARIARETKAEVGLQATGVSTLVDNVVTSANVDSYRFASHVSTRLDWNVGTLGYSVMADDYTVVVNRTGSSWSIDQVAVVPVPPDDTEPAPAPQDPPPSCKPGEVCEPEPLALTAARAEAASMQRDRAAKGAPDRAAERTSDQAPTATPNDFEARFYPQAAAQYALYWSGQDGTRDRYNPQYEKQNNNCTNFVSQAMRAGGWGIKDGFDPDNKDLWTPDLFGPRGPSKTWSRAHWLKDFATQRTDRGIVLETAPAGQAVQVWNMLIADLMFIDWQSDGGIDHVVIAVDFFEEPASPGFVEPTVSQNSPHRQNVPLYIYIKRAALQNPNMTFTTVFTPVYYTK